jgi:hypothetical protein
MIRSGLTPRWSSPARKTSSSSNLSATFNDFLFATVCEERNEMPLSVVSALARLDLDPWIEAAELSRMPTGSAASRLASLLAGVVNDPPTQPDRATIAARLVALLSAAAKPNVTSRGLPAATLTAQQHRTARMFWLVVLASMAASLLMARLTTPVGASGPAPGPTPAAAMRR